MSKYIFLTNVFLAMIITWFIQDVFTVLPGSAFTLTLTFTGIYFLFWSFTWFYSKAHFFLIIRIVGLVLYYFKELVIASFRIAYDIITPKDHMKPAIIALPLDIKSDLGITLLANFITLTPGTLTIDLSSDKKTLYIHSVYVFEDKDVIKQDIKNGFEKRIMRILG